VYGIVPNWEIIKVLTKHFYPDRDTFVTQSEPDWATISQLGTMLYVLMNADEC